jgi:hypothetical protein
VAADPRIVLAQDATPTASPETTETATPTATATATATEDPTATPTATPDGGTLTILCDPADPASCSAPSEVDVCLPDAPPDSPLRCPDDVADAQRQALDGPLETTPPVIRRSVNMGLSCERDALGSGCALSDAGPAPATPAARRVAYERIIQGLRSTRTRSGPHSKATPLGEVVSFDTRLRGLDGQDVAVTWSVFRSGGHARLHSDWFADRRAIVWHVDTDADQGSADIWVPLPPRRGRYFARISVRDANGQRLTYADTPVFR